MDIKVINRIKEEMKDMIERKEVFAVDTELINAIYENNCEKVKTASIYRL